ncbi:MAG: PhzF family phenazine biosynthesis protein [Acetobacteraceae bacterium]
MLLTARYFQVDAFADRPMTGNPAGVCVLPHPIADAAMQAIAAETGLVTAFLVTDGGLHTLRWFTPVVEEAMCGHGTLATAWVVFNRLEPQRTSVEFTTQAGVLTVSRDGDAYTMRLPARQPEACPMPFALPTALGATPTTTLRGASYIALFEQPEVVAELAPDFGRIAALDLPGVIVTAPGGDFGCDFVSRYFAPAKGIPEDPVTGSAHAQLVPYWSARLGKTCLLARQLSRRGGTIRCADEGAFVRLSAGARLFLEGTIHNVIARSAGPPRARRVKPSLHPEASARSRSSSARLRDTPQR